MHKRFDDRTQAPMRPPKVRKFKANRGEPRHARTVRTQEKHARTAPTMGRWVP